MPYIIDKQTKGYWLSFGSGLTADLTKAFRFTNGQALALLRLYHDSVYMLDDPKGDGVWIEHHHEPDPTKAPGYTAYMKDNNLAWVSHQGAWMACDRQTLALSTLRAMNPEVRFNGRPDNVA